MKSPQYYQVTYTKALHDALKENFSYRTEPFIILDIPSMYVLKEVWEEHSFKMLTAILQGAEFLGKKFAGSKVIGKYGSKIPLNKGDFVAVELSPHGFSSFMGVLKKLLMTAKFTIVTHQDSMISDDAYVTERFEYHKLGYIELFEGKEKLESNDSKYSHLEILFFKNDLQNNFMFINKTYFEEYRYHYYQQLWDVGIDDHKCLLKQPIEEIPPVI